MTAEQASLFDQRAFPRPTARRTDPGASKEAAASITPANPLLVVAIRYVVSRSSEPMTQHAISDRVYDDYGGRWAKDTIRSGCARAGLVCVGKTKISGRSYGLYTVPV